MIVKIALASPRPAATLGEALEKVDRSIAEAHARDAKIVCFPEAYIPGLRGQDFPVFDFGKEEEQRALNAVSASAKKHGIAAIIGMERIADNGRQNEGWRYPETVRWAAVRGAKIVFHPQHTGSQRSGVRLEEWGAASSPYYEKAMMMRSRENTIYFASVNYALEYQEAATSLISPSGECQAYLPYGEEGVLVQDIDLEKATGLLAMRYAPDRYAEQKNPESPEFSVYGF